ncbi:MAG: peptide deformylase [Bacteroidaceae bacterium]|nr:peptide deformylase [Bacteroidaceae bacterium]MDO4995406.1 peptide deformylase [Bacteroidales bacterium]
MILPMYIFGQPVLRKVAEDIPSDYEGLQDLINNMFETLKNAEGVGLAAPQVGLPIRVVVVDLDCISEDEPQFKGFLRTYINGHIIEESEDTDDYEEGCLSLPGIHEKVRRPRKVRIQYLDRDLQPHDEWVDGFVARVIQHEFDHLEGRMFVDHISGLRKQMIKKKLLNMSKGNFSCSYKVKANR